MKLPVLRTTARVRLTVSVEVQSGWGPDWELGRVHTEATSMAIDRVANLLRNQSVVSIQIDQTPEVIDVTIRKEK